MSDSETKPGPAAPQTSGADAPTPPGGSQRADGAAEGLTGADEGVGREAADSVEDRHGGTIEEPTGSSRPRSDSSDSSDSEGAEGAEGAEEKAVEENAETSLDQPSEG